MKDRFVKVMLVIIVGLLFLNCVKDNGSGGISVPFIETEAKASLPAFLQTEKFYQFNTTGNRTEFGVTREFNFGAKVVEIDEKSGWVKVKRWDEYGKKWYGFSWINMNQVVEFFETDMPSENKTSNSNK
jgi:hypothetical protein